MSIRDCQLGHFLFPLRRLALHVQLIIKVMFRSQSINAQVSFKRRITRRSKCHAPCLIICSFFFILSMNSILKIFSRQIEHLLRLTNTTLHAFQLQQNLTDEKLNLFQKTDHHQCAFSFDLCHELRLVEKSFHSTCFRLQQTLYRLQALRQFRGEKSIEINEDLIFHYNEQLSYQFTDLQQLIRTILDQTMLTNSPLNTLENLYQQIRENFQILIDYTSSMTQYKSTIYLGELVSDTWQRFYSILGALARLAMEIESFEMK